MADQRTALRRTHTLIQQEIWEATRIFQAALQEERRQRAKKSGAEIEALVATDQAREAWSKIKSWYLKVEGHQTPPTIEGLYHTSILSEDLYRGRPLEGEAILITSETRDNRIRNPVKGGDCSGYAETMHGAGGR